MGLRSEQEGATRQDPREAFQGEGTQGPKAPGRRKSYFAPGNRQGQRAESGMATNGGVGCPDKSRVFCGEYQKGDQCPPYPH